MDLCERQQADGRRHPWELARSRFFRSLAADHMDLERCRRVLDVGAGDGWLAGELHGDLSGDAEVVCWDVNYSGEDLAAPLPHGLQRTTEPPSGTFDLVLLLDVLEHITDDAAFLDEAVVPRLHRTSVLLVSTPAYEVLFSAHDRALGHHRRYRPRTLQRLLAARFEIVERGGLFTTLLPLRAAGAMADRLGRPGGTEGIGAWEHGEKLTAAAAGVLAADARTGRWMARRGIAVPALSTWAVCRSMPPPHGRG